MQWPDRRTSVGNIGFGKRQNHLENVLPDKLGFYIHLSDRSNYRIEPRFRTKSLINQDFSELAAEYGQEDLPTGFEPLMIGTDQTIDAATLIQSDFPIGGAAAFNEQAQGELILSYWVFLEGTADQARFETYLNDKLALDEMIKLALLTKIGTISLSMEPAQPVDGLGEYAREAVLQDEATQQELVAFRRGSIGAFVMHVFRIGQTPLITTQEIANLLDARIQEALADSQE